MGMLSVNGVRAHLVEDKVLEPFDLCGVCDDLVLAVSEL